MIIEMMKVMVVRRDQPAEAVPEHPAHFMWSGGMPPQG